MFKNLTQLYCLIVCIIASTIMMVTISVIIGSITDLTLTEYRYMNELSQFDSNEKYIDYLKEIDSVEKEKWQTASADLVKEKRITAKKHYLAGIYGRAIRSIIDSTSWLITCLFFFLIHWKMHKRSASDI